MPIILFCGYRVVPFLSLQSQNGESETNFLDGKKKDKANEKETGQLDVTEAETQLNPLEKRDELLLLLLPSQQHISFSFLVAVRCLATHFALFKK